MMNTFDTLQTLFSQDLSELHQLKKRRWLILSMTRVVKEEHLGRCCYLAEELLSSAELFALKRTFGLDERQWRAYKTKVSGQ
jgi:primosomal protein N''